MSSTTILDGRFALQAEHRRGGMGAVWRASDLKTRQPVAVKVLHAYSAADQAQRFALEAAIDVTDLAMKACGGAAFSRHLALERLFRDARAGWVMAPTVDHLAEFTGRILTGLPLF